MLEKFIEILIGVWLVTLCLFVTLGFVIVVFSMMQ